jgi:hypothetical protein
VDAGLPVVKIVVMRLGAAVPGFIRVQGVVEGRKGLPEIL